MQVLVQMEVHEGLHKDGFQNISWMQKTVYFRDNVPELQDPNDGSPSVEDGDGEEGIEEAEDTRA